MNNSILYRIHPEEKILQAVKEIDFADFDFKERYDIQEWVESSPDILGEELLIIAKEFSHFDKTKERPDLIALDKKGNIVIIELKRDDSGIGVEWQAIKYASYLSRFKVSEIVDVYIKYIERYKKEDNLNEENVSQRILDFIDKDDLSLINKNQRIILVSHRFAREVTSAVSWLIDKHEVNIKVVQLIPYYDNDKDTHYLQSNVILPLIGEDELIIKASGKPEIVTKYGVGPIKKIDGIAIFFNDVSKRLMNRVDDDIQPSKTSRWAGVGNNFRYFHFWYENSIWNNWDLSYKVWLFDESCSKAERKNKFGIYFEFYKKYLLGKGVTEKNLNKLIEFIKSVDLEGFQFDSNGSYYLECLIPNNKLSNQNSEDLIKTLVNLISSTKKKVDRILENN